MVGLITDVSTSSTLNLFTIARKLMLQLIKLGMQDLYKIRKMKKQNDVDELSKGLPSSAHSSRDLNTRVQKKLYHESYVMNTDLNYLSPRILVADELLDRWSIVI
jgi:hypothetical protein